MNIYIDTEFDGFGGKLISMALVAEDGREFYEVCCDENEITDEWVKEHVVPFLEKDAIYWSEWQKKLLEFLQHYALSGFTIIADWPDDLKYFCEAVITGPGAMMPIPEFKMIMDGSLCADDSKVPHNALHDARAIKEGCGK